MMRWRTLAVTQMSGTETRDDYNERVGNMLDKGLYVAYAQIHRLKAGLRLESPLQAASGIQEADDA